MQKKTIGGKFGSIGTSAEQQENVTLVRRLLEGIYTTPLHPRYTDPEQTFLMDCQAKLDSRSPMFGWRQVQEVVRLSQVTLTTTKKDGSNGQPQARTSSSSDPVRPWNLEGTGGGPVRRRTSPRLPKAGA